MTMIYPKSWFLSMKHTPLEEKEAEGLWGECWTHISIDLWNIYQQTWQYDRNTNISVEDFHNMIRNSVTKISGHLILSKTSIEIFGPHQEALEIWSCQKHIWFMSIIGSCKIVLDICSCQKCLHLENISRLK